ncbi:MAG: ABC transporter substrate-binding protein [Patescibacteria group bacterium]
MDFLFKNLRRKVERFFDRQNSELRRFKRQHHYDRKILFGLNKNKRLRLKHFKYLPKFLSASENRQLRFFGAVAVVCFFFLLFKVFVIFSVPLPQVGGEYSEGLIGSPRFINPILSQTNSVDGDLSRLIFSSLLTYDKNHQLTPDLAERYEVSEDGLIYTFYLRQNVKWHDGESFKADDVIFTVSSLQDTEFKSPLAKSFRGVVAEKIDDYTVKFTLKESFAPFSSMLTFGILPEHLWYNIPPANADLNELNKKPVGTGPWEVESFKKDKSGVIKSYTLSANADYYGAKPYLKQLVFKFYGDVNSALDALKNKSVDGLAYLPRENQADLKRHKNIIMHELEQPQYAAIFFNQKKNALLQADYIRQALALAVDKERMVKEVFGGQAKIIDAPILPGIDNSPDIKKYSYDLEAAAALLQTNGWQLVATSTGDDMIEQVLQKKSYELRFVLTVPDQPQYLAIARIIKESWDQLGIITTIEAVDKNKIIQENINNRRYEILLFSENMSSDPDPFAFWHSSQNEYPGSNLAVFSDSKVDALLEAARRILDHSQRQEKYWEFQKIISQQLPAIFLYSPAYTYPQNSSLKGFDVTSIASYSDRLANVSEWYVKVKYAWRR